MTAVYIILGVLLGLLLIWVLSLYGIRNKGDFHGLAAYPYAHRGLHNKEAGIPENSLRAFRLAAEAGYGAELDVRLSKDGRLVVMHDESLLRLCGVDKNIGDLTAEELSQYCLGDTDEPIPFLEEVLPLFEGKQPLVVEIKAVGSNVAQLTGKVCAMLDKFPKLRFCMEAFDPRVIFWLRKNRPDIVRGQLSCILKDGEADYLSKPAKILLACLVTDFLTKPHFISYRLEDRKHPSMRMSRAFWGIQEVNWTVKTQEDYEAAVKDGRLVIFEGFSPKKIS